MAAAADSPPKQCFLLDDDGEFPPMNKAGHKAWKHYKSTKFFIFNVPVVVASSSIIPAYLFFSLEKIHLWLLSVWINTSRINKINAKANNKIMIYFWRENSTDIIFWRKMSVPIGNPCDILPKNVSKFHSKIVLDLKTWKLASCGKEIPPCFLLHAIFFFSRKFLRALITTYTGLEKEPRSLEGSKPSSSRLTCNHEPRLLTRTKLLVSAPRCCAAQL